MKLKNGAKFPRCTAKQLFCFPQRPAVASNTKTFATWSMKAFGKVWTDHAWCWKVWELWDFPIPHRDIYLSPQMRAPWGRGSWDHIPINPQPHGTLSSQELPLQVHVGPWGSKQLFLLHGGNLNSAGSGSFWQVSSFPACTQPSLGMSPWPWAMKQGGL